MLRGGAFKPRTSPKSFQGLKEEGLEILKAVKKETNLPVITELMDAGDLDKLYEVADVIQIGSRNMQNF
ncbi:chorismate mutase, partial [Phocaeicola vulgatus]|nr:chorismate mutase [Phocaeicola vulgatus]